MRTRFSPAGCTLARHGPGRRATGGRLAVLSLLLLVAPVGCARDSTGGTGVATANGGGPTASASASAATDGGAGNPLKFARCMREHGLSWFPDPKPNGGTELSVPAGTDKAKVDAAMEACKKYAPDGGAPQTPDAAALEQVRQLAKCMRENGVPKFPDPDANGNLKIDGNTVGLGPGDPAFDAAERACAKYQPKGAVTQRHSEGGNG
jgi:hypothetical protein